MTRRLSEDLVDQGFQLRETHISRVFLGERSVFKIKKPVDLGFLDFSTLEKRRAACEAELDLNRRLAPDVYRRVVPVARDKQGKHRLGRAGDPVDWAVEMRRLPDAHNAERLLEAGSLGPDELGSLAALLAAFHARAERGEHVAKYGSVEAITVNVTENFAQTRETLPRYLSSSEIRELEHWQHAFVREKAQHFESRVRNERIRDGHGDLRLEHAYLDPRGRWDVIDCIEFNDRFRYADVCADIAFLAMDLAWHDRSDLSERFVAAYAREANDYDLYPLLDFYESYRAHVRGKVSSILTLDAQTSSAVRDAARKQARRYYLLALAATHGPLLRPIVVAIGGLIGSGKSTLAAGVAEVLNAPVIDADRTRKFLAGVSPTTPLLHESWHGAYSPSFSARVYDEIMRRARCVLEANRPVVLDASFRTPQLRQAALEIAEMHGAPFLFLECQAPRETCLARLQLRETRAGVSDGRADIFDAFAAAWTPVTELEPQAHLCLNTTRSEEENLARVRERLAALGGCPHMR
ncbi:MAG: AAA family ATPase [Proteobacteria bacterium]|nr:AAA family ATPase [Pseudomonadota bacterium]